MFVEPSPRLGGHGQAWRHVDAGERRLENSDGEERTDEKEDRSKRICHDKGGSVGLSQASRKPVAKGEMVTQFKHQLSRFGKAGPIGLVQRMSADLSQLMPCELWGA